MASKKTDSPEMIPRGSRRAGGARQRTTSARGRSRSPRRRPSPAPGPGLPSGTVGPERIQERAYYLFLERGAVHGQDQGDWYAAERELRGIADPSL